VVCGLMMICDLLCVVGESAWVLGREASSTMIQGTVAVVTAGG
jgi:hypothetical protein